MVSDNEEICDVPKKSATCARRRQPILATGKACVTGITPDN
jgi:hypothetical protein